MTELENIACLYSDYYKETHGFRPRHTAGWTLENFKAAIRYLDSVNEAEREWEEHYDAIEAENEALAHIYSDPSPLPYDEYEVAA